MLQALVTRFDGSRGALAALPAGHFLNRELSLCVVGEDGASAYRGLASARLRYLFDGDVYRATIELLRLANEPPAEAPARRARELSS